MLRSAVGVVVVEVAEVVAAAVCVGAGDG